MMNINHLKAGYIFSQIWLYSLHIKASFVLWYDHSSFLVPFIVIFLIFPLFLFLFRKIWNIKILLQEEKVFLELTPPAFTEKTAYTTQQLFSVLHTIGSQRTFLEKLLGKKILFSFEIVSTKAQGIRYIVTTTAEEAHIIERSILSYLPQVRVKQVREYLPKKADFSASKIIEFKLRKHFAFPLAKQNILSQHDPVAYITGMMTKLEPSELIAFQIVVSPTKTRIADVLSRKILHNEDVLEYLSNPQFPLYIQPFMILFKLVFQCIHIVSKEIGWAITEIAHGPSSQQIYAYNQAVYQNQLRSTHIRPARILSAFEQETVMLIQKKIDQELFETTIRAFVRVKDTNDKKERIRGIKSSLAPFSAPKYQSLNALYNFPPFIVDKIRLLTFRNRLLSLFANKSSSLLSISEIADLYHFPYTQTTQTENIVKAHSKKLPAPLSLKTENTLDIVFAKNTYGGTTTPIGLTEEEREKHMYIIGATGTGKSTMILSMVNQDLENGKGICLIDPHGELAESAIYSISEMRKKDFIYFNPDDIKYPIGLNLLELTPGLDEDEILREKELITESVVSLFRKIFSEVWSSHAHRLEYILRNTIQTALCLENPTIFTVYNLLTDPDFQKEALESVEDENLKNFWKNEFGKAGDFQKVKMIGPITSRIGRFLFSPSAKRILEQTKSTIHFDDILDSGKILVCNLSKGKLGEDTSEVLGIMILTKIQLSALKRARVSQKDRKPFYVYVDEFQTFATPSFIQMLSEARKYKIFLVMAEQSTSQQKDKNVTNIILANVGTVCCFRSANPDDEKLMLPQFTPYVEKNEIMNLPSFHFYMKIAAVKPEEPFSGETMLVEIVQNKKKFDNFVQSSRDNYAIVYIKPEPIKTPEKIEKKENVKKEKEGASKPSTYLT